MRVSGTARQIGFFVTLAAGLLVLLPLRAVELLVTGRGPSQISCLFHRLLAWSLNIRVEITGANFAPCALIVANHISWTDIIVIGCATPATFVAKSDVRSWPGLGLIARLNPTLFIARHERHAIRTQVAALRTALRRGRVVLFPEGTTGNGAKLLPFRPALFDAADEVPIQPLTIRYMPADGHGWDDGELAAFAWDGDKAFWPHLLAIVRHRPTRCVVLVHEAFVAGGDRKAAAARSQAVIARALVS